MPEDERVISPAVRDSLALCELREFQQCARHLSFTLAVRRAAIDALTTAARRVAIDATNPAFSSPDCMAARPGADDA
jgi:hypothetical protein